MNIHRLKTINPYFDSVWDGEKRFELRNNDRDFQVGDEIYLQEYDSETETYLGREVRGKIIYVLTEFEDVIKEGYCIFGFKTTQYISR